MVKNFNFGHWPLWPILQFYKNLRIPPIKNTLARVSNLQFYTIKTAMSKILGLAAGSLAILANSTILQKYAHTPVKN